MKRLLVILIAICTYYWSWGQVPIEEVILAGKWANATNIDSYITPDSSAAWLFEMVHLGGRRFKFKAKCVLFRGHYLEAGSQASQPFGKIDPPRFGFIPQNTKNTPYPPKERGKNVAWHKCRKSHQCATDNDSRMYGGARYWKRFRVYNKDKYKKHVLQGTLTFRTYLGPKTSDIWKCEFFLGYSVPFEPKSGDPMNNEQNFSVP